MLAKNSFQFRIFHTHLSTLSFVKYHLEPIPAIKFTSTFLESDLSELHPSNKNKAHSHSHINTTDPIQEAMNECILYQLNNPPSNLDEDINKLRPISYPLPDPVTKSATWERRRHLMRDCGYMPKQSSKQRTMSMLRCLNNIHTHTQTQTHIYTHKRNQDLS